MVASEKGKPRGASDRTDRRRVGLGPDWTWSFDREDEANAQRHQGDNRRLYKALIQGAWKSMDAKFDVSGLF